jgi:hypothetical protein
VYALPLYLLLEKHLVKEQIQRTLFRKMKIIFPSIHDRYMGSKRTNIKESYFRYSFFRYYDFDGGRFRFVFGLELFF